MPQIQLLGLDLPDPELHFNEASQSWLGGAINWDEFWQVVAGDGPCNRERLETRRSAVDNGAWVREAAAAYAAKQAQRDAKKRLKVA